MKNLIYLLSLTLILLFGCKDSVNAPTPIQKSVQRELIPLPQPSQIGIVTNYAQTVSIDGSVGGNIIINHGLFDSGDSVIVSAVLHIPKNAFEGTVDITLSLDNKFASVYFDPAMTFSVPLSLNLKFTGLNLKALNIDPETVDFSYIDSNGNITHIDYNTLTVNISAGLISVNGAIIDHFSRYGFSR